MKLSCPVLKEGRIPNRYSKDGENLSPPLEWSEIPEKARELAVVFENITPHTREPEVHWLAYQIAPSLEGLPEGLKHKRDPQSPADVLQGRNSLGNVGYDGPIGSVGRTYRYRFTLYALDEPLQIPSGATKEEFLRNASGHIIEDAEIIAEYERERP